MILNLQFKGELSSEYSLKKILNCGFKDESSAWLKDYLDTIIMHIAPIKTNHSYLVSA